MSEASGRHGGRLLTLAAGLALAGYLVGLSVGTGAGQGAQTATAELSITYTSAKTFQLRVDQGTVGTSIPAGTYSVLVFDDAATYPSPAFVMSGPGVSISSDLNSTGMGIDTPTSFGPFTFQAGSSYSIRDSGFGAAVTLTITAATGGTGGTGGTTSTGSTGTTTKSSTTTAQTTTSATPTTLGTLKGTVSAAGKTTLTFHGKLVTSLGAGRYNVSIDDRSKTAGLVVWKLGARALTLSSAKTVGARSTTLTLSSGKWFFEPSTAGPKTYFTVT